MDKVKHIVAFSGGLASAVVAKIVADEHKNTMLLYHATNTEPKDNDRFRRDVSEYIGTPITEDSDGRDIWDLFSDEKYLGNGRNTMCSRVLKQDRSLKYVLKNLPAILYFGFTVEEWRRAQNVSARYASKGIVTEFPLIDRQISKRDCEHRVTSCWGLEKPSMYDWAEHANCVPCIKGKKAYWGLIYKFEPKAWHRAVKAEKDFESRIFTEAGSLQEELPNCLRLAEVYLQKKQAEDSQSMLFDVPCECSV